jgi:hypothetical protein
MSNDQAILTELGQLRLERREFERMLTQAIAERDEARRWAAAWKAAAKRRQYADMVLMLENARLRGERDIALDPERFGIPGRRPIIVQQGEVVKADG